MPLPRSQGNMSTLVRITQLQSFLGLIQCQGENETWVELLHALFQASQSSEAGMRECAFRIFTTTPGVIEREHEGVVQEVFLKGFKDSSVDVRCRSDCFLYGLLISPGPTCCR